MIDTREPVPSPRIAVGPSAADWVVAAVRAGGAEVVSATAAHDYDAVVWTDPRGAVALGELLAARPDIRWVQLPWAGVEPYAAAGVFDHDRVWTCGKDVYSEPVAELALTMALMGLRGMDRYASADTWTGPVGRNLYDAEVCVLGAGGITRALVDLLAPSRARVTVVRRQAEPMPGVDATVGIDRLDDVIGEADVVVLALALTPETTGIIDASRLALMRDHAWLINVARGRHVVTDDLVDALRGGTIGGAGLDVTDPEPLPDGHPLWSLPNCFITPHVGNTPEMAVPLLSARITTNVRRFAAGEPLIGTIDVDAGY